MRENTAKVRPSCHSAVHVLTHACTHAYTHICRHAYTHGYAHVYAHVDTHVYMPMSAHMTARRLSVGSAELCSDLRGLPHPRRASTQHVQLAGDGADRNGRLRPAGAISMPTARTDMVMILIAHLQCCPQRAGNEHQQAPTT